MNIRDEGMWPKETPPKPEPEAWRRLLNLREATAMGFLEIEEEKGALALLSKEKGLDTPLGQDMIRQLFFRSLEEMTEAIDSIDEDHHKEELVDAANFLLEIPLLDGGWAIPKDKLAENLSRDVHFGNSGIRFGPTIFGRSALEMCRFGDNLRNRSWMHNAQDSYFGGANDLCNLIVKVMNALTIGFTWNEWWRFFVAKDNVLQFRLASRY